MESDVNLCFFIIKIFKCSNNYIIPYNIFHKITPVSKSRHYFAVADIQYSLTSESEVVRSNELSCKVMVEVICLPGL